MIRKIERADGIKYQVYARAAGKKVYVGTFDSEREATEAEEDHRVTQRKIERGELPPRTDLRRTLAAATKLWLDALERAKSRSFGEYSRRMDWHVLPVLGEVALVDLTKPDVIRWRDDLLGTMSTGTVNTCMATLSSACSWFVDQGWIPVNPCNRIKQAKHIAKVFPWLQTSESITRLLAACADNIRSFVAVLVGTGLRLDEALHLHWDDIDLEHRIIIVHRGRKGAPKSGRMRHVPIFDSVLPVLQSMKLARGSNAMLWPGTKPGQTRNRSAVRKAFKAAAKLSGLPPALRLHDTRHSFASLYLADGGSLFTLSKILGHSSIAITEKCYAHLMPTAFAQDYGRVSFRMPSDASAVIPLRAVS